MIWEDIEMDAKRVKIRRMSLWQEFRSCKTERSARESKMNKNQAIGHDHYQVPINQ